MIGKIAKEAEKYPLLAQFIKFCMVGVAGVTFNYSLFFISYYFLKAHYAVAYSVGFITAIFLAFFLNKKFTFKVKTQIGLKPMMIKYFSVNMASFLLGLFILKFLVEAIRINPLIANVITLGSTAISNFTGSKIFAFKVRK